MAKLKICPFCEKEVKAFWKAKTRDRDPCCKNCLSLYNEKYEKETKEVGGYPRAGSGKPRESSKNSKNKAIAPVSDKQATRLREYRKKRDEYLKENPTCAKCGSSRNITLQHLAGREGSLLTDVNNFMTLCLPCHQWATEFTNDAINQGYARSRLKKK